MKKPMLVAAVLALVTVATPVFADGHRDRDNRRDDRYEHRHSDRHDVRDERRDDRFDRRYSSRDDRRYVRSAPRYYAPRYVVNGRYCDDRRHYRDVHYHVASRDYYSYGYPRDAYDVRRSGRYDATLIVTLPLF